VNLRQCAYPINLLSNQDTKLLMYLVISYQIQKFNMTDAREIQDAIIFIVNKYKVTTNPLIILEWCILAKNNIPSNNFYIVTIILTHATLKNIVNLIFFRCVKIPSLSHNNTAYLING